MNDFLIEAEEKTVRQVKIKGEKERSESEPTERKGAACEAYNML